RPQRRQVHVVRRWARVRAPVELRAEGPPAARRDRAHADAAAGALEGRAGGGRGVWRLLPASRGRGVGVVGLAAVRRTARFCEPPLNGVIFSYDRRLPVTLPPVTDGR